MRAKLAQQTQRGTMTTFGRVIAARRRDLFMGQNYLAAQIKNEEGKPISARYLNDIEHDRRSPSPALVKQFAAVLKLDEGYL